MNENDSLLIGHEGIVHNITAESIIVKIISVSSCAGCHAEGSCSLSGSEEKKIEIQGNYNLKTGDKVTVLMKKSNGYEAVILAYVIPFILVIISLILLTSMNINELTSGIISILILIPYYVILFLLRNRISKRFYFTLKQ
jgi:sigma-E factor negative regulatory protein RseC